MSLLVFNPLLAEAAATQTAPAHPGLLWWFWGLLLAACVIWYSTVTVYVAIRGAMDIREMLRRLRGQS